MRIDRLTSKLQLALSDSQSLAVGMDHPAIEPLHLLQALIDQQGGSINACNRCAGSMAGWSIPTARDWESDNASCNLLVKRSIRISYLPFMGRPERWTHLMKINLPEIPH